MPFLSPLLRDEPDSMLLLKTRPAATLHRQWNPNSFQKQFNFPASGMVAHFSSFHPQTRPQRAPLRLAVEVEPNAQLCRIFGRTASFFDQHCTTASTDSTVPVNVPQELPGTRFCSFRFLHVGEHSKVAETAHESANCAPMHSLRSQIVLRHLPPPSGADLFRPFFEFPFFFGGGEDGCPLSGRARTRASRRHPGLPSNRRPKGPRLGKDGQG